METHTSLHFLHEYQAGDESAAARLFHRYFAELHRFARRRVSAQMQSRVDAEAAAVSAYRSFFRMVDEGRVDLDAQGSLWSLLAKIATSKILRQVEFNSAQKRAVSNELPQAVDPASPRAIDHLPDTAAGDPAIQALVNDGLEATLRGICTAWGQVVELDFAGHTLPQIVSQSGASETDVRMVLVASWRLYGDMRVEEMAERLQCSERTIQRVMERAVDKAEKALADSTVR